ncbi:hypothetical protein HDE_09834 [Halotydeus destructor]|nr:hypothetical protein HDE_09834 [Halotydeus destructor]
MKSIILITMVALALAGPAVPKKPEAGKVATGSVAQQDAIAEATLRLLALQKYVQQLQASPGFTRSATGQRATTNPLASIPIIGQLLDIIISILNGSLLNTGSDPEGGAIRVLSSLATLG